MNQGKGEHLGWASLEFHFFRNAWICQRTMAYIYSIKQLLFSDSITSMIDGCFRDFQLLAIARRVAMKMCDRMASARGGQWSKSTPKRKKIEGDKEIEVERIEEVNPVRIDQKAFNWGQVHQICRRGSTMSTIPPAGRYCRGVASFVGVMYQLFRILCMIDKCSMHLETLWFLKGLTPLLWCKVVVYKAFPV